MVFDIKSLRGMKELICLIFRKTKNQFFHRLRSTLHSNIWLCIYKGLNFFQLITLLTL